MNNPIRAALDAAGQATCPTAQTGGGSCAPICLHCPRIAAKAIAAFLRALPDLSVCPRLACNYNGSGDSSATLADAVLSAAKEERE
jgi:hypothetical protein